AIGAGALVQWELDKSAEVRSSKFGDSDSQLQSPIYDLRSEHALISAYLGPEATEEEIAALIDWQRKEIADAGCTISYIGAEDELSKKTAHAIADGKIVGWFQGRMEWGPRPLRNCSILADPRNAGIQDALNAKVKRRESYGPFSLSILCEPVAD